MALNGFITRSSVTPHYFGLVKQILYSPWKSLESDIGFGNFHDADAPTYLNRLDLTKGNYTRLRLAINIIMGMTFTFLSTPLISL